MNRHSSLSGTRCHVVQLQMERLASSDHTLRRCPALPGWKNDAKCKNLAENLWQPAAWWWWWRSGRQVFFIASITRVTPIPAAALYPNFSRLEMQDFVGLVARSGAGGEMIINPVS